MLPSGNLLRFANLKIAIEIVDLPINSMVIFRSYVSLPEGNYKNHGGNQPTSTFSDTAIPNPPTQKSASQACLMATGVREPLAVASQTTCHVRENHSNKLHVYIIWYSIEN